MSGFAEAAPSVRLPSTPPADPLGGFTIGKRARALGGDPKLPSLQASLDHLARLPAGRARQAASQPLIQASAPLFGPILVG
jgi:hypothetical protein